MPDAVASAPDRGRARRAGEVPPAGRGRASKFLIPEVIFGVGTLAEVGGAVRRVGGGRALLVTDPGVMDAGWVERTLTHLEEAEIEYRLWHDLTPNPKDVEVEAAFEAYVANGCDVLVAVGGGSCIDTAKAVAILSGSGGRILDYEGVDAVTSPMPPMVMVPSTGGSGSDVSQFCVVTDTRLHRKAT
ncbi:MAG: iron-containing alcohol dehydrogenase, partial [Acidimicrobiales bacterium]